MTSMPLQVGCVLPLMNLHRNVITARSPQFTLWFTLGAVHSVVLTDVTCSHHYSTRQSSFIALKKSQATKVPYNCASSLTIASFAFYSKLCYKTKRFLWFLSKLSLPGESNVCPHSPPWLSIAEGDSRSCKQRHCLLLIPGDRAKHRCHPGEWGTLEQSSSTLSTVDCEWADGSHKAPPTLVCPREWPSQSPTKGLTCHKYG